jgi:hypothetical protein
LRPVLIVMQKQYMTSLLPKHINCWYGQVAVLNL